MQTVGRHRRVEWAIAGFGTWMIVGLHLDGWAHTVNEQESFFTPWHGALYSGFIAAVAWLLWEGRRLGTVFPSVSTPRDRLGLIGVAVFLVGAFSDGVWHEIFGTEIDLEALLSPSHLVLFTGGFLMLTAPLRAAHADRTESAPTLLAFLPQTITMTLAGALSMFFLSYLSAFWPLGRAIEAASEQQRRVLEAQDLASLLITNAVLIGGVVFVLKRWTPPLGTFAIYFSGVAVFSVSIEAFEYVELVAPAVVAGVAADVLARRVRPTVVATCVPLVLWPIYFLVGDMTYGVVWAAELIGGSVVLAACSSFMLSVLVFSDPAAGRPLISTRTAPATIDAQVPRS